MKTKFIKLALTAIFGFAITFIISCIPPMIAIYPTNSYSSSDNSSSSETAPSSSSVEPSSSSTPLSSSSVITYTVKYDANGGIGAPPSQEKIHGVPLTLSGATSAKPGYTFASWNTAANGSGVSYAHGASYVTNASVTLYAQWKANTYTVKYDANGGIGAPADQEKTCGVALTLSSVVPKKTGSFAFASWNTVANGSGTSYAPGDRYTDNASVTLYAQWKATYTIKYDANGGIGAPPDQEKIHDVPLILSSVVPKRTDGFAFASWNTAADGNGKSYAPGDRYTNNASVTLYVQWKCSQNGIINGPSVSYGVETYKSVVICGQTWMAKNLNYIVDGKSKCYGNLPQNCNKYGRLYSWATSKGICPSGWHLPSYDEWKMLLSNVESSKGCTNCAGKHLRATSGWDKSYFGLDSYGFLGYPKSHV